VNQPAATKRQGKSFAARTGTTYFRFLRRQWFGAEEAEDLTQGFFAKHWSAKNFKCPPTRNNRTTFVELLPCPRMKILFC